MPSFGLIPVMPSSYPRALPHRKMLQIFFFLLWPRSAKKMEEPNPRTTEEPAQNMEDPTPRTAEESAQNMEDPTPRTTEKPAQNMEDPTIMEWMNPLQEQNNTLLYLILFCSRKRNHVEALKWWHGCSSKRIFCNLRSSKTMSHWSLFLSPQKSIKLFFGGWGVKKHARLKHDRSSYS